MDEQVAPTETKTATQGSPDVGAEEAPADSPTADDDLDASAAPGDDDDGDTSTPAPGDTSAPARAPARVPAAAAAGGGDDDDGEPDASDDTPSAGDGEPEAGDDDGHPDPDAGDDDSDAGGGWHPLLRVLTVLGVVAVLVGTLVVLVVRYDVVGRLLAPDRTAAARPGDCLARLPDVADSGQRRTATARIVDCSSPEAAYDVVGRLDDQTGEQAQDSRRCEPFVAQGGTYYTYSSSIPDGGTGYLLCLVPRG